MKLSTVFPLAHLFFRHWDANDAEMGVIVAKARFGLSEEGLFYNEPDAPDLIMSDVFAGDPRTTPLLAEQDIAPAKTGTDVTLRATAHAAGSEALTDWPVALSITAADGAELLTWGFQVRGPTVWRRNRLRWKTELPIPVTEVPLDYAHAYGGTLVDDKGAPSDFYAENPAGTGFATPATLKGVDEWPAPQIGELAEFMAGGDPTLPLSVRGFGPVAKSWTPRQALAGTFDEHWQRTRHPRMPHDYDFGFWNAAPSALQIRPYLRGDEVLHLTGLDPRPEPRVLPLPGVGLDLRLTGDATAEKAMALDTVALDVTEKPVLDLTWRAAIADPETYAAAEIGAYALTPAPAPQPAGA